MGEGAEVAKRGKQLGAWRNAGNSNAEAAATTDRPSQARGGSLQHKKTDKTQHEPKASSRGGRGGSPSETNGERARLSVGARCTWRLRRHQRPRRGRHEPCSAHVGFWMHALLLGVAPPKQVGPQLVPLL